MTSSTADGGASDVRNGTSPLPASLTPLTDDASPTALPSAPTPPLWYRLPPTIEIRDGPHGRGLLTTAEIPRGGLALSARPVSVCIDRNYATRFCEECHRFCRADGPPLPLPCRGCGVAHYCSEKCRVAALPRHGFECRGLCLLKREDSKIDRRVREHAAMCVSIDARMRVDPHPSVALAELLSLMMDSCGGGGKRRERQRLKGAKVAKRVGCDYGGLALETLEKALASGPLNEFGLWNEEGTECGRIFCPHVALANHSCLPNCVQRRVGSRVTLTALRDIAAGEVLTHAYINPALGSAERAQLIKQSWNFQCRCERCRGSSCVEWDRRHVCRCGAVVIEKTEDGADTVTGCGCNLPEV